MNTLRHPPKTNRALISSDVMNIYQALFDRFGPQSWWPGDTPLEVIVGAVLTQNTNWGNVEKAIVNLKKEGLLTLERLHEVSPERLSRTIKPAGYFNVKAKRLKNVAAFFVERYGGDLDLAGKKSVEDLRCELLSINGVGPETADSILLYAFAKPAFVVDAYTKRFLTRHNLVAADAGYDQVQKIFLDVLARDGRLFNEYHALIVKLAKDFCRTKPRCEDCPLRDMYYNRLDRCEGCYKSFLAGEKRYSLKKENNRPICQNCRQRNG